MMLLANFNQYYYNCDSSNEYTGGVLTKKKRPFDEYTNRIHAEKETSAVNLANAFGV